MQHRTAEFCSELRQFDLEQGVSHTHHLFRHPLGSHFDFRGYLEWTRCGSFPLPKFHQSENSASVRSCDEAMGQSVAQVHNSRVNFLLRPPKFILKGIICISFDLI